MIKFLLMLLTVTCVARAQAQGCDPATTPNCIGVQGHGSSVMEAIMCSAGGDETAGCKLYMTGFGQAVGVEFMAGPEHRWVCDDVKNLPYEFINEVKTNPTAREQDTEKVLLELLTRNKSCKSSPNMQVNILSAGDFIDGCHSDQDSLTALSVCSTFEKGVTDAVFYVDSHSAGPPTFCGNRDQAFAGVIPLLNQQLESNYKLRDTPAAALIIEDLGSLLRCPKS